MTGLLVVLIAGGGPLLPTAATVGAGTLSVQSIYAHLQSTRAAPGKAYHVVVAEPDLVRARPAPRKEQVWVDGAHDVARQQFTVTPRTGIEDRFYLKDVTIQTWHDPYQTGRRVFVLNGTFPTCHGAGIGASLLIGRPLYLGHDPIGDMYQNLNSYTEKATTSTYQGKPAVLLQVQGTLSNADGTFPSTAKLYLDPQTFMPIARLTQTWSGARVRKTLNRFTVSEVNASALPRGFFDPATLGYRGVDATLLGTMAHTWPRVPVYWLGMHWKGVPTLAPLAVRDVGSSSGDRVEMSYAPEADRFGGGVLHFLEVNGGNGWPTPLPSGPCFSRQTIALSGGYGIIVSPRAGQAAPLVVCPDSSEG